MKSYHYDDGSSVHIHEDGSSAIHTKDGAWIDFVAPKKSQHALNSSIDKDKTQTRYSFRDFVVYCLLGLCYIFYPLIALISLVIPCLPYCLFADLLDEKGFSILALLLTVVFWIVVLAVLVIVPWKKLRPNRQWLLAPIRFLRKQLRQLEIATRP